MQLPRQNFEQRGARERRARARRLLGRVVRARATRSRRSSTRSPRSASDLKVVKLNIDEEPALAPALRRDVDPDADPLQGRRARRGRGRRDAEVDARRAPRSHRGRRRRAARLELTQAAFEEEARALQVGAQPPLRAGPVAPGQRVRPRGAEVLPVDADQRVGRDPRVELVDAELALGSRRPAPR